MGGTSEWLWLVRILVLWFVIPEACTYSLSLCYEVGAWFIIDCLPYEWRSGTSDGIFVPISPPKSICSSTLFWGLINFCNKYVSSLRLMSSSWIIRSPTLPSLLASLVPRNFRRYHAPTIFLPQNSHHTYLSWHFHSYSEIFCLATFHRSVYYDTLHHCHISLHDHVVDIVFVAKPPFIILSYMSLMSHCISRYTAGGIHIESYLVLSIEL